jgi:hypothetical protein
LTRYGKIRVEIEERFLTRRALPTECVDFV